MRRTMRFAVPTLMAVGLLTLASKVPGQQKVREADQSPFHNKVLVVQTKSEPEFAGVIEAARVRHLGKADFLVGKGAGGDHWASGRTIWVAMSDISRMIEFDSVEEYERAAEEWLLKNPGPERGQSDGERSLSED